jgi:hypothetical protein
LKKNAGAQVGLPGFFRFFYFLFFKWLVHLHCGLLGFFPANDVT